VDQAVFVGMCHAIRSIGQKCRRTERTQSPRPHDFPQVLAVDVFEDNEDRLVIAAHVVHGDAPGMVQPGGDPRFLKVPDPLLLRLEMLRPRHLDRNKAIQLGIMGQVNLAEAPLAQQPADHEPADLLRQEPLLLPQISLRPATLRDALASARRRRGPCCGKVR